MVQVLVVVEDLFACIDVRVCGVECDCIDCDELNIGIIVECGAVIYVVCVTVREF